MSDFESFRDVKIQKIGTIVAELWCNDFHESLRFYTASLGFSVGQHKEGSTHAYLTPGAAQLMTSDFQQDGTWETGSFSRPLGGGINFSFLLTTFKPFTIS